ncbi:MAG: MFS transporter [Candidatus Eremiobacteraeota bacterium]|nr:MFS transporter [Candidatus Eremiobacteraeota bacterium]
MTAAAAGSQPRNVWVAFGLLSATFFMLLVDFSVVTIALPTMESELHMDATQGQWIVSTYAIFLAGFLMLTGRCADIFGRRRFFVVGLALFTVASLLGGLAQNGTELIAMRALQGLGAALVNPAALAIVLSMFAPGPARSRAIALWGTIGSSGVAAGIILGGILVQYLGWRSVLFVNVPFALIVFAGLFRFVPRDVGCEVRQKLDVAGAILLTATLVTFVYTIEEMPVDGFASPSTLLRAVVTLVLFGAFLLVERRASEPILPPRLFRYPDLLSGALVVALQPMSYAGVMVFVSIYAQRVSGYDALMTGFAFMPSNIVTSFVAAPLTMPLARLMGIRSLGIAAAVVQIAGESILLFMTPHSSYWLSILPATCIGVFGGMLVYQTGMIAGLAHVDDADEGTASAAMSFALQLGIGFGVALCAVAQNTVTGKLAQAGVDPTTALAGGLHAAFWTCIAIGVLCLLAVFIGIRHAAKAEVPLRHYLAFGRIHHKAFVKS